MRIARRFGATWLRRAATPILACLAGVASPAAAGEEAPSFYLGARAIGGYGEVDDITTSGFTGATNVQNDTDVVGGVGLVVGYAAPRLPVRLELEVAHRFRFDFDVRDVAPAGTIDYEMNIATTSALASAIVEWRNQSDFTPFAGGSVGWARNSTEVTRIPLATQASTTRDVDKDNLAWGATVGLDWAFAENWVAEAAYRYTDLGEVDAGTAVAGDQISADTYISHDLLLSIYYRF